MKATIKVCTASKNFSEDQKLIMRRVVNVLMEHELSVAVYMKAEKVTRLRLKVS